VEGFACEGSVVSNCCLVHTCALFCFCGGFYLLWVLLLFTWRSCCLFLLSTASFEGLHHWQNCPIVHFDRDQTLEV
jgi:hypothetical protein